MANVNASANTIEAAPMSRMAVTLTSCEHLCNRICDRRQRKRRATPRAVHRSFAKQRPFVLKARRFILNLGPDVPSRRNRDWRPDSGGTVTLARRVQSSRRIVINREIPYEPTPRIESTRPIRVVGPYQPQPDHRAADCSD